MCCMLALLLAWGSTAQGSGDCDEQCAACEGSGGEWDGTLDAEWRCSCWDDGWQADGGPFYDMDIGICRNCTEDEIMVIDTSVGPVCYTPTATHGMSCTSNDDCGDASTCYFDDATVSTGVCDELGLGCRWFISADTGQRMYQCDD